MIDHEKIQQWSELLEYWIQEKFNSGTSSLAYELCQKIGKDASLSIETATRNINNWRAGTYTPSRVNFRALTEILDLRANEENLRHWNRLYANAQRKQKKSDEVDIENGKTVKGVVEQAPGTVLKPALSMDVTEEQRTLPFLLSRPALVTGLGGIAATLTFLVYQFSQPSYDEIPYVARAEMKVGESRVIHGKRGTCGGPAPSLVETQERISTLELKGRLTVGNVGYRYSRRCAGKTLVRAIIYTAVQPGNDVFFVFDDAVRIEVTIPNH